MHSVPDKNKSDTYQHDKSTIYDGHFSDIILTSLTYSSFQQTKTATLSPSSLSSHSKVSWMNMATKNMLCLEFTHEEGICIWDNKF